jgi:hypothetical protein
LLLCIALLVSTLPDRALLNINTHAGYNPTKRKNRSVSGKTGDDNIKINDK